MAKVAATKIDLLILGLLLDGPMHGYDLYQQIVAEGIDDWFSVSMAGVYYSLGKMRDQGLVAESRQRGERSARKSVYHLTEEGRTAFFAIMDWQAADEQQPDLAYDLVIYMLNKLPLPRALALLEERRALLRAQLEAVQAALAAGQAGGETPLKLAILDHRRRFLAMEHEWLAEVVGNIQGGTALRARDGARRSLMVLSGDLGHYHLPDLLRLIASGHHDGTLSVSDGAQVRTITFRAGQPVSAACRRRDEPPGPPPAPERLMAELCDLFRWQEGQFTFDQEEAGDGPGAPLRATAEELVLAGCRWVDNWGIIQRLVPSADIIFEASADADRARELGLTPAEARVLAAIDGAKDVAAVGRELGLTLFETSRAFYCLAAVGAARTANLDKIRLRRVFREIAELMCSSTAAWRTSGDDRTCEQEVNARCAGIPLSLNSGRIEDQAAPQLKAEELGEMYRHFLQNQVEVVSRRFGRDNARQSYERTLRQLAPELQAVAHRYGLDRIIAT